MALGWRKEYYRYKGFFLNILEFYKKSQDLRMFLEILLSLATTVIFLIFALKPTAVTISSLIKEIKSKQDLITKMDDKIQNLNKAQNLYAQEKTGLALLDTAVPKNADPANLIRQIEAATFNNNVSVTSATLGEAVLVGERQTSKTSSASEPLPEGAESLDFALNVSGEYDSLFKTLMDLEIMRRPLKIGSLKFSETISEEEAKTLVILVTGQAPFSRVLETTKN